YKKYGLDPHTSTILIMGGGQGLGPLNEVVASLEKVKHPLQEIVVTGTNKKLHSSLNRRLTTYKKKIKLFGYTDRINELMSIADCIITKPGGVTCAEVLSKNIPMIIIKPIPGQEANNTAYLTEKGAALKVDEPSKIHSVVENLFANPDALKFMSTAAARISKPNASTDIATLALNV
ncbi:MAG: hypothetical protein KKC84_03420, partial [Candidatus Omnitrophica bacterium]|nr:hypothetical protein [Candidatus Omnitrophota bacterium]